MLPYEITAKDITEYVGGSRDVLYSKIKLSDTNLAAIARFSPLAKGG
jgi:hypothetical protein